MAQKFTLIPTALLDKIRTSQPTPNDHTGPTAATQESSDPGVHENLRYPDGNVHIEDSPHENALESLPLLLPKKQQHKATVIVHFLKTLLKLDTNQRVVYEDGTIGSHLLDLLRFFTSPISVTRFRPLDALKFGLLMRKAGVPDYAIGRQLVLKRKSEGASFSDNKQPTEGRHGAKRGKIAGFKWKTIREGR